MTAQPSMSTETSPSARNNLFEIPYNEKITHFITRFTTISITSILPILTILNTVFIKFIPVRQHDINSVKLEIQKFLCILFKSYTICSA